MCDNLTAWLFLFLQLHSNNPDKLLTQVSSDAVNNLLVSTNLILCFITLIISSPFLSNFLVLYSD